MNRAYYGTLLSAVGALMGAAGAHAAAYLLEPDAVWTAGEPAHPGWVVAVDGDRIVGVGPKA